MYHIDGSQTHMDSFNVTTTLAGQPSAPESTLGMFILFCCLKNLTKIKLLWLELTPLTPFDDVSRHSASKWHILWCYDRHDTYKYSSNKTQCLIGKVAEYYIPYQQRIAR